MSKLGIILALFLLAATAVHGRPLSEYDMRMAEVKRVRTDSLLKRKDEPCESRRLEVEADLLEYNKIQGGPRYFPECTKNGKFWREAQCDHHENGSCFCVHKENGKIKQHTKNKNIHKEELICDPSQSVNVQDSPCLNKQTEFTRKQEEYGLQGHSPLFYYPECTRKGQFKALQRNDRTFFCVDTSDGEVIPDTKTKAGTMPPLTEQICRAYDEVWNKWKTTRNLEEAEAKDDTPVTRASCKPGFTYTDCGCPIKCTHETTEETDHTCICKQACVCPDGMYDLDGKCVSLEECNEAKPPTSLLQADKLRELAPRTWKEYHKQNLNAVLETYNQRGREELEYAGGPVAYDHNPASYFVPSEPPLEGDFVDGEQIPGSEEPNLLYILRETGDPDSEQMEYYERNFVTEQEFPSEERETAEPEQNVMTYPREEGHEYTPEFPEEENQGYFPEEENQGYFPEDENQGYFPEEENQGYFPEEENGGYFPEEENGGYFPEEENEIEYVPREEHVEEEYPTREEEQQYIDPESILPEEEEQENEIDERIQNERLIEHQIDEGMEFSSVPKLRDEEMPAHQTPPCDEPNHEPLEEETVLSEEEAAAAEINRVLEENGIVVEAMFEKPTPSVKKNNHG